MLIQVTVNGALHSSEVQDRTLLVDYLRGTLGLTGTKVGCDESTCGSCTILLDGRSAKACTILAAQADGREVTTIEGLADGEKWHPVQRAFTEHHALQCGFCTPGMVLAVVSLIRNRPALSEADVRAALRGNLCRCTGYHNIIRAVLAVSAETAG